MAKVILPIQVDIKYKKIYNYKMYVRNKNNSMFDILSKIKNQIGV